MGNHERVPTINVLSKNIKNIKTLPVKFSIFISEKFHSILVGHVFALQRLIPTV